MATTLYEEFTKELYRIELFTAQDPADLGTDTQLTPDLLESIVDAIRVETTPSASTSANPDAGTVVTDHGQLTGAADDDHTQYLLRTDHSSSVVDKTDTDVTVASTTDETTVYSTTIAGGALGTNNILELNVPITSWGSLNSQSFTIRIKYGGTTLITTSAMSNESGGTVSDLRGWIRATILANGSATSQFAFGSAFVGSNLTVGSGGAGTSAVNSAVSQALTVTVQWGGSSASNTVTVGGGYVVLHQA